MICPACKSPNAADAKFCGTCGRQLVAAQVQAGPDLSSLYTVESDARASPSPSPAGGLAPGSVFAGRYEIKTQLADAIGADHYLAYDRTAGTDVSLKLVRLDPRLGGDVRGRFLKEAAAARDIRHPNIAAVYDVGESDGQAYFTMEALNGVSLRDWNRRRLTSGAELGMSSISAIIFAILDAIMSIHIRNLIRIDLKPANITLLSDPSQPDVRLKLTDVGVPYLSDAPDSTTTGIGGNPYRAPEALTAAGSDLQHSADIYSVSMIFYELLAGVPLAGHWQAPSTGRKDVPPAVDALIQNGLSNNPRRRPQSAEDYRKALSEALGTGYRNDPKPAPKPPEPRPDPKPSPSPKVEVKTWPVPGFLVPVLKFLNMPFMAIVILVQNIVSWIEVLMFATRPLPFGKRKAVRTSLTVAVVAFLLVGVSLAAWGVSALVGDTEAPAYAEREDEPVRPLSGSDDDDPGGYRRNDPVEPENEPEPVTPVRTSRYAAMNGYWMDDFGDTWSVSVDELGRVQALATGGFFAGSQMSGAFVGDRFEFLVSNAFGTGGGVGTFDGQCHIRYQTLDPAGSGRMLNVALHINHPAGATVCP